MGFRRVFLLLADPGESGKRLAKLFDMWDGAENSFLAPE
jgi:hypothetical protein